MTSPDDVSSALALRARIQRVGEIRWSDDGRPQVYGWHFDGEGRDVPSTLYVDGELTALGGWTIEELHLIAHGFPCRTDNCPLDQPGVTR